MIANVSDVATIFWLRQRRFSTGGGGGSSFRRPLSCCAQQTVGNPHAVAMSHAAARSWIRTPG